MSSWLQRNYTLTGPRMIMKPEDLPILKLVTLKVKNGADLSPLEMFILHHQPITPRRGHIFRCDLADLLGEKK